ncbi:MAG: prepilin-type N-terminal cleavage/methylation domain-containing protein [Thermodesulfovibrionales bacterium]|nr:prepilin-type N-terminal cleavage/methylation domain-containing protein [Thermodesulfovibrionales bacterium]
MQAGMTGVAGMTEGGFTLVEVLISMVVLLLVSLALMQTALVSIDSNMINVLRDEAVGIAEEEMNEARGVSFSLLGNSAGPPVQRNIRNINFSYTATRTVTNIGAESRQVVITITWNWKGNPYTHSIASIVRR